MAKELEIKILEVDIDKLKNKIEKLGGIFISDSLQQIYTYDFIDISSVYDSILYDFKFQISEKTMTHALKRLIQLFFDLNDLIEEFDTDNKQRAIIYNIFGTNNIYEYIKNIKSYKDVDLDKLLNPDFIDIVNRYRINPNKWIRLRKSKNKTTLTIKQILGRHTNSDGVREHSINNVLEYETGIESFEKAKEILEQLGYYHKNYQEKRRIQYRYNNLEIDIDSWPHIPPYMEIEGKEEEAIYDLLLRLGYHKENAVSMNTDDVYTYYGLDMYSYKELKFSKG